MLDEGFYRPVYYRAPDNNGQIRTVQAPFDYIEYKGVPAIQPRSRNFGVENGTETAQTEGYNRSGGGAGLWDCNPQPIVLEGAHVMGDTSDGIYGLQRFDLV